MLFKPNYIDSKCFTIYQYFKKNYKLKKYTT